MIPGLLFLFVWELLANLPGYLPRFTITAWLRSLIRHRPADEGLAEMFGQVLPAGPVAWRYLRAMLVVFLAAVDLDLFHPRVRNGTIGPAARGPGGRQMNTSRLVVLASALVVGAGALTAVGALYLDPARAAVGPAARRGPGPARRHPVRHGHRRAALRGQPVLRALRRGARAGAAAGLRGAGGEDGINPERDVDQVYVAGRKAPGKRHGDGGVVVVVGTLRPLQGVARHRDRAQGRDQHERTRARRCTCSTRTRRRPQGGRGGLPRRPHPGHGLAQAAWSRRSTQPRQGRGAAARQRRR